MAVGWLDFGINIVILVAIIEFVQFPAFAEFSKLLQVYIYLSQMNVKGFLCNNHCLKKVSINIAISVAIVAIFFMKH